MIIISANLPASDLFDKESNIENKGAGVALLKSSTKYSPELLYHQQSHYFALIAISHYFLSYSPIPPNLSCQNVLLPFLLPLLQFLRQCLQDLPPLPSFPAGWKQFGIAWAVRVCLEPSRASLTPGRGWQVLSCNSRDSRRLPWPVPTSSQVNPWA